MKKALIILVVLLISISVWAGTVDTSATMSTSSGSVTANTGQGSQSAVYSDTTKAEIAYRIARKIIDESDKKTNKIEKERGYLKARDFLIYAYKKDPKHKFAIPRLVIVCVEIKDYKNLNKYFEPIAIQNPTDYKINFDMGTFAMMSKDWNKALKYLNISFNLKNDYIPTHYNLGLTYIELKNYDEGIKYSLTSYEKNYNLIDSLRNLVRAYYEADRLEDALKYCNILIEKTGGLDAEAYQSLALIYAKKNDYPKAIEYINKAISLKDNSLFRLQLKDFQEKLNAQQQGGQTGTTTSPEQTTPAGQQTTPSGQQGEQQAAPSGEQTSTPSAPQGEQGNPPAGQSSDQSAQPPAGSQ